MVEEENKSEQITVEKSFLENLVFFSDQVRFNEVLYQGYVLILKKIINIEEKIDSLHEEIENINKIQKVKTQENGDFK